MGGRVYFHPLWGTRKTRRESSRPHEMEIGITAVTDLERRSTSDRLGGMRLLDENHNLIYDSDEVLVLGADLHYKLQIADEIFLAARADYGFIWTPESTPTCRWATGGAPVARLPLEPPTTPVTNRVYGEYRMIGTSYIPAYFDQYYAVQRYQYASLRIGPVELRLEPHQLGYPEVARVRGRRLEHSYRAHFMFDLWRTSELYDLRCS